jgi:hypothetical protein
MKYQSTLSLSLSCGGRRFLIFNVQFLIHRHLTDEHILERRLCSIGRVHIDVLLTGHCVGQMSVAHRVSGRNKHLLALK